MNSLNRQLILIATSALAITATIGFLLQTDAFNNLKVEFNKVFKENEKNKQQIKEQALTIRQLGEEIFLNEDSIRRLNIRVAELVDETIVLKEKIRTLDKKVYKLSDNVNSLTKKISALNSNKSKDQQKIKELAKEREEILKQMELMDKQRTADKERMKKKEEKVRQQQQAVEALESSVNKKKESLERLNVSPKREVNEPAYAAPPAMTGIENEKDEIIAARKQSRMKEIVTTTRIDFKSISLRDEKSGKSLDKIKENGWRYTIIEFDMKNADPDAIYDEDFIVQIFDVDNQRVVPYNESNPGFPDSHLGSTGHKFTYEGEPMKIAYFNSQKKTGKNYEVRFYYAGKGFLLPIKNGNSRIVEKGTVVERL